VGGVFWTERRGTFSIEGYTFCGGFYVESASTMSVAKYANLPYIVRGLLSMAFVSRFG